MRDRDHGCRTVKAVPNGLATAGATLGVPGSEVERLLAVTVRLVTDATAGNRNVVVTALGGDGVAVARTVSGFAQTPSSTADYSFSIASAEWDSDLATTASGPLFDMPLDDGDTITVTVTGAGAADALQNVRLSLWQRARAADRAG